MARGLIHEPLLPLVSKSSNLRISGIPSDETIYGPQLRLQVITWFRRVNACKC